MDLYSPYFGLRLPDDILVNIFKYLEMNDRIRAAATCRQWNRIFFEPTLWRSVDMTFASSTPWRDEKVQGVTDFVNSVLIKTTSLSLAYPPLDELVPQDNGQVLSALLTSISNLSRSTVQTFRCTQLNFIQRWEKFNSSRCQVAKTLSDFLETQTQLRVIGLTHASIGQDYAPVVLYGLARSQSLHTLQSLDLSYLCTDAAAELGCANVFLYMAGFCPNMSEVTLNYSFLRSLQVDALCGKVKDSLRKLNIVATAGRDGIDRAAGVIDQIAWASTCELCPELRVSMTVYSQDLETVVRLLVPGLPLVALTSKVLKGPLYFPLEDVGTKTGSILNRLAKCCSSTLESASLEVTGQNLPASTPTKFSLVNVLTKCTNIRSLKLSSNIISQELLDKALVNVRKKRPVDPQVVCIL